MGSWFFENCALAVWGAIGKTDYFDSYTEDLKVNYCILDKITNSPFTSEWETLNSTISVFQMSSFGNLA